MKAVWYRVMNDDGTPTRYVGFAMAKTTIDLFWEIDQFVDPYRVQIKNTSSFGLCLLQPENIDDAYSEYEVTSAIPSYDEDGWVKPKWPPLEDVYVRSEK